MALSLRVQLSLVLVSLAVLSTATVGGLAYYSGTQLVKRDAGRAVETSALVRQAELISLLTRQRDAAAQFLLTLRSICRPRDPACMRAEMAQFMAIQRAEAVQFIRPGVGTVAIGGRPDREPLPAGALADFSGDDPLRSYRIAVHPSQGERLTVQYPMALVAPIFENRSGLGESGEAFLINRRGRFVTPTRNPNRSDTNPSDRATRLCLEGRSGTVWDTDYRGMRVIHGFRPLGAGPDACIMTHIAEAEAVAPILELRTRVLGLSGLFAVLAVACSLGLARAYTRPLARLTARARALQAGDVERGFPEEGPVEVRTLARTFTAMAASLTDAFAARTGLLDRERAARLEAESARRRTSFLSDASAILGEWLHDGRALERVAGLAASHLGGWCTIDVVEEGTLRRRGAAHADPGHRDVDHMFRRVTSAIEFYPGAENVQTLEPRIAHLVAGGLKGWSCLLVPIRARDRTWGLITLASGTRRYDEADLALVNDVAHRAALAIETAWLYREVQQGRARLEAVLHQMPAGVVIAEAPSGRWVSGNDRIEQIFRRSMAGAHTLADWMECPGFHADGRPYGPDEWPLARSLASGETIIGEEIEIVRGDGTRGVIEVNSAPIYEGGNRIVASVATFYDMTDRKRVEEETLKTGKLDSIGLLAGGIAHDFNNVLTAILGNLFLVRHAPGLDADALKKIDEAERATLRGKHLTLQLLTFARGGSPVKRSTALDRVVRETTASVLDGTNVRAEFHIPDEIWPAEVDENQIRQVIGHLAANAQQAMPDGGCVTVEIRNRVVVPDDRLPLDPGRYVVVWIIDQGIGISKAILPRIFDPYFTTKPTRTGLGLATCYSIVKKHRGYIAADSTPGVRTTFTLFLPAAAQPQAPARPVPPPRPGAAVLLMDDDPSICEFAVEMLTRFGYRAASALEGAQAVDLYRRALVEGRPFDVVILDLTVPGGMDGIEALAALREIDPRVRAVVSSGYSNDPVMADWARYGFAGTLPKPYEGGQLLEIVTHVLGPSPTEGTPSADRAA